jgi:hypothetical protein
MAEETVWRGTSSQWKNFGLYILCALFCWLIVPIFIALARYLQTKSKVYDLTTERLKITEGVFSKVTNTLELYRVKDLETRQHCVFRLSPPERIFALDRRDRLDRVCTTNGLRTRFTKTKVLHLAFPNQVLDGSRYIFDWHI